MKIVNITKIESEVVYDITVDNAHHYVLENGVITHNSGLKYAANNIIALSKSKEKDAEGTVTGAIIRCKNIKSRLTREGTEARVLLSFDKGLDRYYGLIDIAIDAGVFKKLATKIEVADGTNVFEKHIIKNPTKFFTEEVLKKIDEECKKQYKFGKTLDPDEVVEEMLNGEEETAEA